MTTHDGAITSLEALRSAVRRFSEKREWQQLHTPKNLTMALAVEAAELLEHFQWLTPEQSTTLNAESRQAVAHEIADVLIYLIQLADVLAIDPLQAAETKLKLNARKYPYSRVAEPESTRE